MNQTRKSSSNLGNIVGAFGFVVGIAPTLFSVYLVFYLWWEIESMEQPPRSIRPMFLFAQFAIATAVGIVICLPLSLGCSRLAEKLGAPTSADISRSSAKFSFLPIIIGICGVYVVCVVTGVELAS